MKRRDFPGRLKADAAARDARVTRVMFPIPAWTHIRPAGREGATAREDDTHAVSAFVQRINCIGTSPIPPGDIRR
jgi:hypothetical protein